MYTHKELTNRVIWLFREPRSGSTWFRYKLLKVLNREYRPLSFPSNYPERVKELLKNYGKQNDQFTTVTQFFKNRNQELDDINCILDTHHFSALLSINNYTNPILIRIARKNRTEQFISGYLRKINNILPVFTDEDLNNFPKLEHINIPEDLAYKWVDKIKNDESLWNAHALPYENETVYYENLLEGWNSKILPISMNMNMNVDEPNDGTNKLNLHKIPKETLKLPYNKKQLVKNYEQIDKIISDCLQK